jgi:RNA polymerase sigma-70 factor (ECF subfamily)
MAVKNIQELAVSFMTSSSEKDFVELYKRIKPGLLNHCKSILIEQEAAEDAVSNTMAKIWTKITQYDPTRGNFSTWVYNIARNESLVIKKCEDRYMPIIQEMVRNSEDSDDHVVHSSSNIKQGDTTCDFVSMDNDEMEDLYDNVIDKMNNLPEIYKDILYDREILRMKYQEIADKHGMKKRAIATRIRRARLKVREMFPGVNLTFNN